MGYLSSPQTRTDIISVPLFDHHVGMTFPLSDTPKIIAGEFTFRHHFPTHISIVPRFLLVTSFQRLINEMSSSPAVHRCARESAVQRCAPALSRRSRCYSSAASPVSVDMGMGPGRPRLIYQSPSKFWVTSVPPCIPVPQSSLSPYLIIMWA